MFTNNFETLWPEIAVEMQAGVKTELMAAIHQETAATVRKKICDCFSELARNMIGMIKWDCLIMKCVVTTNWVFRV